VARYLLLPEDEAVLHEWLVQELGLVLVRGPVVNGEPVPCPLEGFPWELPSPAMPGGDRSQLQLIYWRQGWSANDLTPWGQESAAGRVAAKINADSGANQATLDLERTRAVVLRRSGWTRLGALHVASLSGSARPTTLQDPDVAQTVRRVEQWLARGAQRVTVDPSKGHRPVIFARPEAAKWVAAGGEVWPWDA
jgi:hypothetical protein